MEKPENSEILEAFYRGLTSIGVESLESTNNKLFRLLEQAVLHNQVSGLSNIADTVMPYLETAEERLGVDSIENGRDILALGGVEIMLRLITKLSSSEKNIRSLMSVSKKYKYLNKCMRIVYKEGIISGTELRQRLNIEESHRSNLANFFRRISDFKVFSVKKIGNTNYYSLTSRGEELWDYISAKENDDLNINVYKQMYLLLDSLSNEMRKAKPSTTRVLLSMQCDGETWSGDSRILNYKINTVFKSREVFERKILNSRCFGSCVEINDSSDEWFVDDVQNKKTEWLRAIKDY